MNVGLKPDKVPPRELNDRGSKPSEVGTWKGVFPGALNAIETLTKLCDGNWLAGVFDFRTVMSGSLVKK
jgi:hypothetical protein